MGNFREYEIKVQVRDIKEVENNLRKMGAQKIKSVLQIDRYLDFLPLKISKKDELLRVRTELDQKTRAFVGGEFSWKSGRRGVEENYEVRDDISVPLRREDEIKRLTEILIKLGLQVLARLEKIRDRWILKDYKDEIEFEFDKKIIVSSLNKKKRTDIGGFIQATIETSKELSDLEAKNILWKILKSKLDFMERDFEPRSYIEIYLNLKKPIL
jgi:adenylate cyclase class IV